MKSFLIFLLVLTGAASVNVTAQNLPFYLPANGLVAWYPFNGNANDESGHGNHGTVNGALLTHDRYGKPNSAYAFNSSETITGSCNNFPSGNQARSVSFWYNADSLGIIIPGIIVKTIWGYGGFNCGNSWIMDFENSNIHGTQLGTMDVQGHCAASQKITSYPLPANNTWHHVVITYDGYHIRFYFNGNLTHTSDTTSFNTHVNGRIFSIGQIVTHNGLSPLNDPAHLGFNGDLDDFAIWDRSLNSVEILRLYRSCTKLTFFTQTQDQTINVGDSATYFATISDSNAILQWQVDSGGGFQNLSNGGRYSGVNSDTLIITDVLKAFDGFQFRCIGTLNHCCAISTAAQLNVNCTFKVTNQPINDTLFVGEAAQFTIGTNDSNAIYQWQEDKGQGFWNVSNGGQFSGAMNDTLSVSNVSYLNRVQTLRCIVTSQGCKDTSNLCNMIITDDEGNLQPVGIPDIYLSNINIYPNPAKNQIIIPVHDIGTSNTPFVIFDLWGRPVQHGLLSSDQIDISNLSNGIYTVKINSNPILISSFIKN